MFGGPAPPPKALRPSCGPERDQLVRHTELSAYSERYAGMQTYKIKGEGHFRILKNPLVIGKILEFLQPEGHQTPAGIME